MAKDTMITRRLEARQLATATPQWAAGSAESDSLRRATNSSSARVSTAPAAENAHYELLWAGAEGFRARRRVRSRRGIPHARGPCRRWPRRDRLPARGGEVAFDNILYVAPSKLTPARFFRRRQRSGPDDTKRAPLFPGAGFSPKTRNAKLQNPRVRRSERSRPWISRAAALLVAGLGHLRGGGGERAAIRAVRQDRGGAAHEP